MRQNGVKPEKGLTCAFLATSWGVFKDAPRDAYNLEVTGKSRYARQKLSKNNGEDVPTKKLKNVIDCRQSAKAIYTPFRMYCIHRIAKYRKQNPHHTKTDIQKENQRCEYHCAEEVWQNLPSSLIAQGFVLALRISRLR